MGSQSRKQLSVHACACVCVRVHTHTHTHMENNTSFEKFQVRVTGKTYGSIIGIVLYSLPMQVYAQVTGRRYLQSKPLVQLHWAYRTAVPRICREHGRDPEETGATWGTLKGNGRDCSHAYMRHPWQCSTECYNSGGEKNLSWEIHFCALILFKKLNWVVYLKKLNN